MTVKLGKELEPHDTILNFVPDVHLTLDVNGLQTICHLPENITRQRNEYLGFRSKESYSLSSYRIEPDIEYEVIED